MLTGYFCRVKKKKKSMEDCMKNILQSLSSAIEEQKRTQALKHARAGASFVLNSGSRTLYALYFGTLNRKKSVTLVATLCFFLCLCSRFAFFIQVYLWRGSARKLCSRARIWYFMLCFLFWTKFFPSMEELQQFLHAIGSREMNSELCTLLIWQGKGCFIYAIWKQDIVRAQQIKYPFAFFFFCSLSHKETTQNYFQLSLPSYIYE